jgi:hypothetical protein
MTAVFGVFDKYGEPGITLLTHPSSCTSTHVQSITAFRKKYKAEEFTRKEQPKTALYHNKVCVCVCVCVCVRARARVRASIRDLETS